jgi:hypothetical protein
MLLLNPKKIEEQVKANPPAYIVTASNLEPVEICYQLPSVGVYGTTVMSPDLEKEREDQEKLFGTHLNELKENTKTLTR